MKSPEWHWDRFASACRQAYEIQQRTENRGKAHIIWLRERKDLEGYLCVISWQLASSAIDAGMGIDIAFPLTADMKKGYEEGRRG